MSRVQFIVNMPVNLEIQDATGLSADALSTLLIELSHRPFDLTKESALRINLLLHSTEGTVLLLTAHHIATDFWSMVVLMDELRILYKARRSGTQADLPLLRLQYSDYARWEAGLLESEAGQQSQTYWREQLAGDLPVLNLPIDRPRPLYQTYRGTRRFFDLGPELTQQIRQVSLSEGVTIYTTLLATFYILLYHYSGQEDLLVGSPVTSRSQAELQNMVGYLVNPAVLRANLAGNPHFTDFLQQVYGKVLAALDHQEYSFMQLVERMQPERDASRSPIFDVMFVLDRPHRIEMLQMPEVAIGKPGAQFDLGGLLVESFPLQQQAAQFDVTLLVVEAEKTLSLIWEYNTDLFDEPTLLRMAQHYQLLLRSIVADPAQRISQLPSLLPTEHQHILADWCTTQTAFPQQSIHELFAEQVKINPDAIAVISADGDLTYNELNQRANQLAHYLHASGVGPDVLVGLCLERSPYLIISILAIR